MGDIARTDAEIEEDLTRDFNPTNKIKIYHNPLRTTYQSYQTSQTGLRHVVSMLYGMRITTQQI